MAEQTLFVEKVRNPKKLDEWIPLRRVRGEFDGTITSIQYYDKAGNPIDMIRPVTVIRNLSPKMVDHASTIDVVDGVELDEQYRVSKVVISRYQLPYPSAVTSTEEPVADDTVVWINPGGAQIQKTVRRSYNVPEEDNIRLWLSTAVDEGGFSGSTAVGDELPKTSSVLTWTEDNSGQEQVGIVYTGLSEPTGNETWWIQEYQESGMSSQSAEDPLDNYDTTYAKVRTTSQGYTVNFGEFRSYYEGTTPANYLLYCNDFINKKLALDPHEKSGDGKTVNYDLKLRTLYGASDQEDETSLTFTEDSNGVLVVDSLNVNPAYHVGLTVKITHEDDSSGSSDGSVITGSAITGWTQTIYSSPAQIISAGYDPENESDLAAFAEATVRPEVDSDDTIELTSISYLAPTRHLLVMSISTTA